MEVQSPLNEDLENWIPEKEPQLYLCDDWIQPVMVARKPRSMTAKGDDESKCCEELSHSHADVLRARLWLCY